MNAPHSSAIPVLAPRPRGRPKAEDIEALEERLLSIARQTFIAHGYGATSMASIARTARVSKNTLYARFGSKAELFGAIISDQIGKTDFALGRSLHHRKQPIEEALRAYIEHMLRISLSGEMLQINRLIYSEAARFPELGRAASERMQIGVDQVTTMLVEAAARDGIPCRDPQRAAAQFIMLTRGWYGDILLRNSQPGGPAIRRIASDIVGLFVAARSSW